MAVNWKTPLQSLINLIGSGDATRTTQSWLTIMSGAPNPYAGLTWAVVAPNPDQWGIMSIATTLAELGPWSDVDGRFDSLLQLVVTQAISRSGWRRLLATLGPRT